MSDSDLLYQSLQKLNEKIQSDPKGLSLDEKKRFWSIVGKIKRQVKPNEEIVELASEIREQLYQNRFGNVKPIIPVLTIFTICGIGFFICSILFAYEEHYSLAIVLSLLFLSLLMINYLWVIQIGKFKSIIIFLVVVGSTLVFDALLQLPDFEYLNEFNKYYIIIAVPSFYLYGRLIGGYIGGISFDGVSRDIFYLPTMKINYKSYLQAPAPRRKWIFLCGGLGTVLTSITASTVLLIIYNDPILYIFPLFLFFGELLDYLNLAGPLGGAEFNHLRREIKIIRDWKKNLQNVNV